MWSGFAYGLVVEGVDGQCLFAAEDALQEASFCDVDGVRCAVSGHVLGVFDGCSFALRVDVLVVFASECCCHYLYASADAEHGYLSAVCFACECEFCFVALWADATELWQWFFAEEEGVDVASS